MKEKLEKFLKKLPFYKWFLYTLPKLRYVKWFRRLKIDEHAILLESQHGTEISGNIFYLVQELATNPLYKDYKVYLSCRVGTKPKFEAILEKYNIKGVIPVVLSTKEYMKVLASAKYLFNDSLVPDPPAKTIPFIYISS